MNNNFMKINLFVLGAALTIGMSLTSCAQDDMLEKNKTEEKEHKNGIHIRRVEQPLSGSLGRMDQLL